MTDSFKEKFRQAVAETEAVVYSYLPEETGHQKTIFEAMNYSVKAGGKRLRPLLPTPQNGERRSYSALRLRVYRTH